MAKQNELSVVDMDRVLAESQIDKVEAPDSFTGALQVARGMVAVRDALTPHMPDVLKLKGTKLGFLTDESNKKQYTQDQIRDALVEGLVRGARVIMNEINIIAGGCYLTKEYYHRRISEMEGITNLSIDIGFPHIGREPKWEEEPGGKGRSVPGSALVSATATWKANGVPCKLECKKTSDETDTRIPVRLNLGYGLDQVMGLAESKLLRRVYKRITGSEWVKEDDVDVAPAIDAEVTEVETTPAITEETLNGFRERVERRFERCSNQQDINKLMTECATQHPGDLERLRIVNDLAESREMQIDEQAHAVQ